MGKAVRHQGFCFTHNNWAPEDAATYLKAFNKGFLRWIIWGKETAPTTGTPHLQGFFWTSTPATLQNIKKKFNGSWIAVPGKEKGPTYWNEYCSKQDVNMTSHGVQPTEEEFQAQVPKGAGARSDLLEVKRKIDEGVSCQTLVEDDDHFGTFAAHNKFFESYQSAKRRRRGYCPPYVEVRYGPTGTNKTRYVHEKYDYDDTKYFVLSPEMTSGQTVWYDGYAGHEAVLFEEFRPGTMKYASLLSLLDGYPHKVQVKGGTVHWSPTHIYICSPVAPEEWFPNLSANDKIAQLMRRISKVTYTGTDAPTAEVCVDELPQFSPAS